MGDFFLNIAGIKLKIRLNWDSRTIIKFLKFRDSTKKKEDLVISLYYKKYKKKIQKNKDNNDLLNSSIKIIKKKKYLFRSSYFKGECSDFSSFRIEVFNKNFLTVRNAIRFCFSLYLTKNQGIMLHSSGIIKKNRSLLFFGMPNSGKSTIACFAKKKGHKLLNDEFNVVLKKKNYFSFSTPFGGDLIADNIGARLKNLYLLKKSPVIKLPKMSIEKSFVNIFQNNLLIMSCHYSKNSLEIQKNIFKLSMDLVKSIKTYKLFFKKEDKVIQEVIKNAEI